MRPKSRFTFSLDGNMALGVKERQSRLVALDLVRFFAAFSVVLYHYTARNSSAAFPLLKEITKFGYLGVPLFFMISGYVISFSANNRSAAEFVASRFARLYPAFWAGISVTCITTALLGASQYSTGRILANLTMFNTYLGFEDIEGVYWTLHEELKFYGCVSVLLLFGVFSKFKLWLSVWVSLAVLHLLTHQPVFMGWLISPIYSSSFIAGVAFYLIRKDGVNRYNISILLVSLIVSGLRGFGQANAFMDHPGTATQLVSVLIIFSFYVLFYLIVTDHISLGNKKIYFTLGGLTYPLYLMHNIAGKTIIDNLKTIMPEWFMIVCVALLFLSLSYLVHVGIEKKISTPFKITLLSMLNNMPALSRRSSRPQ
jgi:peptidoglycan/LPS O-acetylase OafA/YrhL